MSVLGSESRDELEEWLGDRFFLARCLVCFLLDSSRLGSSRLDSSRLGSSRLASSRLGSSRLASSRLGEKMLLKRADIFVSTLGAAAGSTGAFTSWGAIVTGFAWTIGIDVVLGRGGA